MKGYVYILKCNDDSYYVGSTKYLKLRIAQHQAGEGCKYTAKRLPVTLCYFEEHEHIGLAFAREHQIKRWSKAKKKALVEGDIESLKDLAWGFSLRRKKLP